MRSKFLTILRWDPGVRVALFLLLSGTSYWWLHWGAGLLCRSLRYSIREAEQLWISLSIGITVWLSISHLPDQLPFAIGGLICAAFLLADAIEGSDQFFFRRLLFRRSQ